MGKDLWNNRIKPYLREIKKWKYEGNSDRELARKLGIGYSTFRLQIIKHKELQEAVEIGRFRRSEQIKEIIRKDKESVDCTILQTKKNISKNSTAVGYKYNGIRPDKIGPHRRVFERNRKKIMNTQNICGICGHVVDFTLKPPHPLSPCVDHIIPIAKGGHPSDIENLQLAHWSCNRQKSDKLYSERKEKHVISNRNLPQSRDWSKFKK